MITTQIYHSMISVKPQQIGKTAQCLTELKEYSLCKNEPFSFQLAYKITDNSEKATTFFVKVISDLPINSYYINCVPVMHTDFHTIEPIQPIGMYPDILVPKTVNAAINKHLVFGNERYYESDRDILLCAYNDSWQAMWFAVNEDSGELTPGTHEIRIELYDKSHQLVGENQLTLEVLKECLPAQSVIYTNWFHYDCLAEYYNLEIFSEPYFKVMRDFVRKATKNGMNMLLLPAFTPPLDTPIGTERMTAQLVKIKVINGSYHFDFSLMKQFIDMCRADGIRYFEHSHLFTQWGAEHAPKIVADVDGKLTRIFGWDTDAVSEEYVSFLRAYLTKLRQFLQDENLENHILFHISDEPTPRNFRSYEKSANTIKDLLEGYMVGDALSDPQFFESGLVPIPIASTRTAAQFANKGDNIWCYYTGAEVDKGMSNRLIQLPRERNRSLGIQMYYYNTKGFLHWAYNFYYGAMSYGGFNPALNPCGGYANAGTSYFVYPANDGTAYQSVRQKIFAEALIDIRALQLLESLSDRSVCEELIIEHFGVPDFYKSPDCPDSFIAFRKAVNDKIKYYSTL